jgi:broad specificity phosphatase PhoE
MDKRLCGFEIGDLVMQVSFSSFLRPRIEVVKILKATEQNIIVQSDLHRQFFGAMEGWILFNEEKYQKFEALLKTFHDDFNARRKKIEEDFVRGEK